MAELQKPSPGSHLDRVDDDYWMWKTGTEKSAAVRLGGDCLQLFAVVKILAGCSQVLITLS